MVSSSTEIHISPQMFSHFIPVFSLEWRWSPWPKWPACSSPHKRQTVEDVRNAKGFPVNVERCILHAPHCPIVSGLSFPTFDNSLKLFLVHFCTISHTIDEKETMHDLYWIGLRSFWNTASEQIVIIDVAFPEGLQNPRLFSHQFGFYASLGQSSL